MLPPGVNPFTQVNPMTPKDDMDGKPDDTSGKPQMDSDKLDFIKSNEKYWKTVNARRQK
jgi:hypothetical protein